MQKSRNRVFDAMLTGNTPHEDERSRDAVQNFTDIAIMEIFGLSYQQLNEMPLHLYEDIVLIMNKRHALEQQKINEMKNKMPKK